MIRSDDRSFDRLSRVRQGRRDEKNSLPHVLWRLAKKSPPSERGRSCLPPRTAARVMPASRAEDGTARPSCPLLRGGSRPFVPPRPPAPHRAFGGRSSHAARAAQTALPMSAPHSPHAPHKVTVTRHCRLLAQCNDAYNHRRKRHEQGENAHRKGCATDPPGCNERQIGKLVCQVSIIPQVVAAKKTTPQLSSERASTCGRIQENAVTLHSRTGDVRYFL